MKTLFTLLLLFYSILIHAQNFEIYVSDAGNFNNPPWQILKFDQNGQTPVVFINTNLNWPQDILFLEDSGQVLISNLGSGKICRHNAVDGTYLSDFATGISGPTRMKIGPDGLLYVLQWSGNGKVRRYQLDGTYLGEFTSAGVAQSIGIDWDINGNLYVSSYSGLLVRKFDVNGMDQGNFVSTNLVGPTNIWFDVNGDLLVADYNGNSVNRFDSQGTFTGPFITGLDQCEGVAFMPNGNILIGNGGTNSVKMFDDIGNYIQDLIAPGSGNLLKPNAVVIRPVSGTAIPEYGTHQGVILYPSAGNEFYISHSMMSMVDEIRVFTITGQFVKSLATIDSGKQAGMNDLAEGSYVIVATLKNHTEVVQRIIKLNN